MQGGVVRRGFYPCYVKVVFICQALVDVVVQFVWGEGGKCFCLICRYISTNELPS